MTQKGRRVEQRVRVSVTTRISSDYPSIKFTLESQESDRTVE